MAKLHEMLAYLRKKKDMSQQELADKIGVSRSTVGMYETGKREPEIDILQKLSDIYGVSMNTLTGIGYPDLHGNFDQNSSPEKLLRIENTLFFSPNSFTTEKERPAALKSGGLSPEDARIMDLLRRLSPENKRKFAEILEALAEPPTQAPDDQA